MTLFLILFGITIVGYFTWKRFKPAPVLKVETIANETVESAKVELEKKDAPIAIVKAEAKRVKKKYGGKVKKEK
jgi:hypothetical protein